MKIMVGMIGPERSIAFLSELTGEFMDRLDFLQLSYDDISAIPYIVEKHVSHVDAWLFTGPLAFERAPSDMLLHPAFYIPVNESSLVKVLLQLSVDKQGMPNRLSIDTITTTEVYDTLADCNIQLDYVSVCPYQCNRPTVEYVQFHESKYASGQVDACVTAIHYVFQELTQRNVPVYRMTPTRLLVRKTLEMICQQGQSLRLRRSQVAIQLIEVDGLTGLVGSHIDSYGYQRMELLLGSIIVDYGEALYGSFVSLGSGKYMVFSTSGQIDNQTETMINLQAEIQRKAGLRANIGIGYGTTSLSAERNAHVALNHAKKLCCCQHYAR